MKQKDRSETEYLKGIIRKLESENRQLKRELKNAKKYEAFECDEEMVIEKPKKKKLCKHCGEGEEIKNTLWNSRVMVTCTVCDFRKSVKHE